MYVLALSEDRQTKETRDPAAEAGALVVEAACDAALVVRRATTLLLQIGAAKSEAGRAFGFVQLSLLPSHSGVTRQSFPFRLDKAQVAKPRNCSTATISCARI